MRQAYTVTGEEQRPRSVVQLLEQALHLLFEGTVGARDGQLRWVKAAQSSGLLNGRSLDIERNIDPNRTGTAVEGKIDSLLQMVANVIRVENCDRILRNWLYD